jgi:hypothetical protein
MCNTICENLTAGPVHYTAIYCMQWTHINDQLQFAQQALGQSDHGVVSDMYIRGPHGAVRAYDIGWIDSGYYEQYPDRLWDLYLNILAVLDGHYHCCLSGRVWNF